MSDLFTYFKADNYGAGRKKWCEQLEDKKFIDFLPGAWERSR